MRTISKPICAALGLSRAAFLSAALFGASLFGGLFGGGLSALPARAQDATVETAPPTLEGDPIDASLRREQQHAGLVGLGIWTLVGLGAAAWIGLRWKLPRG